jgi:hypothetical protein
MAHDRDEEHLIGLEIVASAIAGEMQYGFGGFDQWRSAPGDRTQLSRGGSSSRRKLMTSLI